LQKQNISHIDYQLQQVTTQTGIGFYSSQPKEEIDYENTLDLSKRHPNDEFIRRHLIRHIMAWDIETLSKNIRTASDYDTFLLSAIFEACLHNTSFYEKKNLFTKELLEQLIEKTPLVFLRSILLKDHTLHKAWINLFRENIINHKPLPLKKEIELSPPIRPREIKKAINISTNLTKLRTKYGQKPLGHPPENNLISREAVVQKLYSSGIDLGTEMRHISSLSPYGVLRPWQTSLKVLNARHDYSLAIEQTAYGRGLDMDQARLSCIMEIVERASAFASFEAGQALGYVQHMPLTYARASKLMSKSEPLLNPSQLHLEAPYQDDFLYWIQGSAFNGDRYLPIFLPAQCVFLFCNLDEIKLFTSYGSTGLAAGTTLEMAKLKALLEVIERDCDSTCPFDPHLCFEVKTDNPYLSYLFDDYKKRGVHVQFQDITSFEGIPCYRAFIQTLDNQIVTGAAASLDAQEALLAAMTEIPYPYPCKYPTKAGIPGLPKIDLNELPIYSTGAYHNDLQIMENLLSTNGYCPVYVNLTKKELDYPVIRALVPGMEMLGDLDEFSRVHPRLYANYCRITGQEII